MAQDNRAPSFRAASQYDTDATVDQDDAAVVSNSSPTPPEDSPDIHAIQLFQALCGALTREIHADKNPYLVMKSLYSFMPLVAGRRQSMLACIAVAVRMFEGSEGHDEDLVRKDDTDGADEVDQRCWISRPDTPWLDEACDAGDEELLNAVGELANKLGLYHVERWMKGAWKTAEM